MFVSRKSALSAAAFAVMSFAILLLSVVLLSQSNATAYGVFAALQLLQGLMFGVLSSLVLSPLLVRLSADPNVLSPFMIVGLLLCLVFALLNIAAIHLLGADLHWLWVAASAFLHCWRWLLRGVAQLTEQPFSVAMSDAVTGITLVLFCPWFYFSDHFSLNSVFCVLAFAGLLGVLVLRVSPRLHWTDLSDSAVWRRCAKGINTQGRHALSGTFAAELAANAHSYLAAFLYGPLAFAPIAAATLLFRPQAVLQQNLQQTERVALRRALTEAHSKPVSQIMQRFLLTTKVIFGLNAFIALLLVFIKPYWLWQDTTTLWQWQLGCGFMTGIILLRIWRSAYTMLLQAADLYALLARLAWQASVVMLVSSLLIMQMFDVVWCLSVVLLIELWLFFKLRAAARLVMQQGVELKNA